MRITKWSLSILVLMLSVLAGARRAQAAEDMEKQAVKKGEVVFQHSFEAAETLATWGALANPRVQLAAEGLGKALQVERIEVTAPSTLLQVELPATRLRGCKITIEARVRAENVSVPPASWNGIKVMLHTRAPGGDTWPQQNLPSGTFSWKAVRYTASIPDDATQAHLTLGLEAVTGRAWFDDIKVTIASTPRVRPQTPPKGPRYKGHNLPRLRGAMVSTSMTPDDLRVLGSWGANHVRWQLTWNGFPASPADNGDLEAYSAWLEGALKHLDSMLPLCRELGIQVLVDLHTPPGGRNAANECRLFKEKRFQDAFLGLWDKLARRYKNEKTVWGYDLVNEPVEGDIPDGVLNWRDLALATAKRVRAIDPAHAIVVEGAPWGGPQALAEFEPLPLPNIVYSFHMYEPHEFTHQNVYNNIAPISYPGTIGGKQWDKEQLRRALAPVRAWQRDYNVHVYVGEFSAIRWAPGESAFNYLRDCIDIFEENNWDWAYHAFREWPGWSVEHSGDKDHTQKAAEPTSRQKLFMQWFARNNTNANKTKSPMLK